ncbi:MAG: twin-arginine translocation signal domain-containing protein [Verrucomicrobia bacterium]|nr:twin-arginine translocation signal domain-containing protein [Verrucomicrobiota bacterium]
MIERREFLRYLALTGVAAAVGPSLVNVIARPAPAAADQPVAGVMSAAAFSKHAGSRFHVEDGSAGGQWLSLEKIRTGRVQPNVECFSLLFHGPASAPMAGGTYRLTHADLGVMDVHVIPGTTEDGCSRYRASFARKIA